MLVEGGIAVGGLAVGVGYLLNFYCIWDTHRSTNNNSVHFINEAIKASFTYISIFAIFSLSWHLVINPAQTNMTQRTIFVNQCKDYQTLEGLLSTYQYVLFRMPGSKSGKSPEYIEERIAPFAKIIGRHGDTTHPKSKTIVVTENIAIGAVEYLKKIFPEFNVETVKIPKYAKDTNDPWYYTVEIHP